MSATPRFWKALTPLTRRLTIFALLNGVALQLALMVVFLTPWQLTIFGELRDFVTAEQGEDSWGPMNRALEYVLDDPDQPVYDEIFFEQQRKFQYPPMTLLPLRALQPATSPDGLTLLGLLNAISWLSVVVTVVFTKMLFDLGVERSGMDRDHPPSRGERIARGAVVVFLALTFYPMIKAYTQGQIQAWITALFAVALWLWATGRPRSAGALVGATSLIKPQYGPVFLAWGALRRRWGFTLALAAVVLLGTSASLALFGLADHVNYVDVLRFISERGESYYPNHSVNGLVHRVLFNGDNLGWKGRLFPPYHPWVYGLTLASSAVFILVGLMGRTSSCEKGGVVDFCVIAVTSTLASPVAWEHHYGILLPIFAYFLPVLWAERSLGRRTLGWVVLAYVLCSNFFAASTALASIPVVNVGQSYLFFGALMVWLALLVLRGREPARVTSSAARQR
jgi:hypothetical protein